MGERRSWAKIAASYRRALETLIDALDDCQEFEVEGGAEGNGPLVAACRAIRKPLPPNLREWLAEGDRQYRETIERLSDGR